MKARAGVLVMSVLLALYIGLIGWRAVVLFQTGDPVAVWMGVALVVLGVIGAWALVRELLYGRAAERLGVRLEAEGGLPTEEVEVRPSGGVRREDADALFPQCRAAVEEAPDDWRNWYRLGLVYDGAGDRKRARAAIREAIKRA